MARIVPAKPKMRIQAQKEMLWQLQEVVSDDFIIFQNKPAPGGCILMKSGAEPVFIYLLPPTSAFDTDTWSVDHEDGSEDDIDELADSAAELLSASGLKLGAVAVLGDQAGNHQLSIPLEQGDVPLVCLDDIASCAGPLSFEGSVTTDQIQGFLTVVAPGSSPYEPGTVTEGQLTQRAKRSGKVSAPVKPVVEVASGDEHINEYDGDLTDKDVDSYRIESAPEPSVEPDVVQVAKPVRLPPPAVPFHLNLSSSKRVLHLENMIEGYLDTMRRERQLYAFGVDVESDFVASADGMLPALLIAASEEWTPIVVATRGHAGFDIRMTKDPEALIGFRIIDVLVSTPSVLYMPLAHMLKNCFDGEGYVLDTVIEKFGRWVQKYELENTEIDDIGMHIALKALEADD